jgi:hypothetical protein
MEDKELKSVLVAILTILKEQTTYLHRQHGWVIALAETISLDNETAQALKKHHFFFQGPREDERITAELIQRIDELTRKLWES